MTNLALNKRVIGKIVNSHFVTDGISTGYTDNTGFGHFEWPSTLIVDLDAVVDVRLIRFLLWDGLGVPGARRNPRQYKYRLLTTTDSLNWTVHFETGDNGYNGWQTFRIEPGVQVRQIQIHGLHNSANEGFHIVELEAYADPSQAPFVESVIDKTIRTDAGQVVELNPGKITLEFRELVGILRGLIIGNPLIKHEPFEKLLRQLGELVNEMASIESSAQSIRNQIIDPVRSELEKASRLGRFSVWGFWVGIIGGVLAIISILVSIVNR